MHATESYRTSTKKQLRNAYYKITPNLLFEYQCTSVKFIRLPNRIESKKIDSVAKIESNRIETFFARIGMLYYGLRSRSVSHSGRLAHSRIRVLVQRYTTVSYRIQWQINDDNNKDSDETNERWTDMSKLQYEF